MSGFVFLQIFQWTFKALLRILDDCGELSLLRTYLYAPIYMHEMMVGRFENLFSTERIKKA